MHCANLDALVKGAVVPQQQQQQQHQSPQRLQQQQQTMETKEEENSRILKTVLDAGILILEGRLPDRSSKRGYVEGPHCVLYSQTQPHQCDLNRYVCKRAEKYRQLIRSSWSECKGICIELRVCGDCSCGEEQVWKNTCSSFDYVLEQWFFEVTNVRNEDEDLGIMNWYSFMQAIRSQIHFSQLSAWWSSNRAQLPKNITYHVLPLVQADVNSCPLQHKFPVLSFTTKYLQVKVRSQPRSETLPNVHCPVHCNKDTVFDDRMKILCYKFGKHHCQAVEDLDENDVENWCCENRKKFADGKAAESESTSISSDKRVCGSNTSKKLKTRKRSATSLAKMAADGEFEGVKQNCAARNGIRSECDMAEPRIVTFHRTQYNFEIPSSPFQASNMKNLPSFFHDKNVSTYSCKPKYFAVDGILSSDKFDLSSNTNLLPEDAPGQQQFFNICNWTNTVVSNMMSRMRNGNSLLDSNALSELFTFNNRPAECDRSLRSSSATNESSSCECKTGKELGTEYGNSGNVVCDKTENVAASEAHSDEKENGHSVDGEKITNTITATLGSGDTSSKINSLKAKAVFCSNNAFIRMEVNGDEPKKSSFKGCYKPVTIEEIKLKNFNEKRFHFESSVSKKRLLPIVGNVIESVLSGRVCFTKSIENFKIKITSGASFAMQNCTDMPAVAYHYHFGDGNLSKSYMVKSFLPETEKGIQIPNSGRLQVGIFNTEETLIKVFTISYDLTDMPRCSKTYLRHSNYCTPKYVTEYSVKWLQSFLQLKCRCSKSGHLYLQNEISAIIFQKSDLNTACELNTKTDLRHDDVTELSYKKELDHM